MHAASVTCCSRSDLHPFHEREKGIARGCTTGHEFVGVVVALGTEVSASGQPCACVVARLVSLGTMWLHLGVVLVIYSGRVF